MSRQIKLDEPLSEKDIKYLKSRGRHADVLRNQKKFGSDAKSKKTEEDSTSATEKPTSKIEGGQRAKLDQDIVERVRNTKGDDLKVALAKAGLKPAATERESRIALAQHLQAEKNKKE